MKQQLLLWIRSFFQTNLLSYSTKLKLLPILLVVALLGSLSSFAQNNALHFDGSSDIVDCGNPASVQVTGGNLTIEAWIKADTWKSQVFQGNIINKEQNGSGNDRGYMMRVGNNGRVNFNIGNGNWNELTTTNSVLTLNQWHHIACVYDSSTMTIYVDGTSVATKSVVMSISNSTANLSLGNQPGFFRHFNGAIDEVRIWDVARTATEIQNNRSIQISPSEAGLVAYYQFNQGVANGVNTGITTLDDETASSSDGTLNTFLLTGTTSNWVPGAPLTNVPDSVDITFQVNTANITVDPTGLFVGGGTGFGGPSDNQLTDANNDGIYEITLRRPKGFSSHYIFVNGNAGWGGKEDIAGLPCADPNNFNDRFLPGVYSDTTLMTCYETCATDTVCPIPLAQPDLPITFEDGATIDYNLFDFGGNSSIITADPTDPNNTVVESIKQAGAQTWAGTLVANDGMINPIPFTANATKMSVRVWSPDANTPVLLKVENDANPSLSVETLVSTTVAGQWETLVFDFSNHSANTPALDLNQTYDQIAIFFNFGSSPVANKTYYWDDVEFGVSLTASTTITDVTCGGGFDGSIFVTITNGTAPYSDGTNTYTTDTFTIGGLPAGAFNYVITDANGVSANINGTVQDGAAVTLALDNSTNVTCNGGNDGTITLLQQQSTLTEIMNSSDGLSFLQYPIVDAAGNLYIASGGNDKVFKRDINGVVTEIMNNSDGLDNPLGLALDAMNNLYIADRGNSKVFRRDVNGVVTEIMNSSDGLSGSSGLAFDAAGNLYITSLLNDKVFKRDVNGVVTEIMNGSDGIDGPVGIAIDAAGNFYISCLYNSKVFRRDVNGVVTEIMNSSDGISFSYGITTDAADNLYIASLSNHKIFKRDVNGVITEIINNIINPVGLAFDAAGDLYITSRSGSKVFKYTFASGGPLTYSIDGTNFQASNQFTGLAANNYTVTAMDANGCTATLPVTITEPTAINISATESGCDNINNNGITVTASGGTAPYSYSTDGVNYQFSNTLYPLAAGTYTVYVKDAINCVNTLPGIVVSECINVSIISATDPSPYAKITPNHLVPLDLGVIVQNGGGADATNLAVTFDIQDNTGSTVFTETLTQALFEKDSTKTFMPTMSFTPDTAIGKIYTVTYSISIDETESDTTDNIVVATPLEITDSTHAKDDGNFAGSIGISNGSEGLFGHNYTFNTPDSISSVAVTIDNTNAAVIGQPIQIFLYETVNGAPSGNPVDSSNVILADTSSSLQELIFTFANPYPVDTGTYFIGIKEGVGIMSIAYNFNIFTPNTGYFTVGNGASGATWTKFEDVNFPITLFLRPNLTGYNPFEAAITNSTDVSCLGGSDGSVEITVAKGTAPFTVNGTQYNTNTINISGLSAGNQTFAITDANGNFDTLSVTIGTVPDVTPPTVVTQNITVYLDASGNASITASNVDNGTTDNCQLASTTVTPSMFTCADIGANSVVFRATDATGNTDSVTVTVTVADTVSPTATAQNFTVQLDASGNAAITTADINNGSSDNCGTVTLALDQTAFTCANVGPNTVTLTVTDANNNSSTATATVTVQDAMMPTVATQNITVQLDASGNASITTAQIDNGSSDNCGVATLALDVTSFDCSNVGANTVTLTVTDVNGNTNTGLATVTVEDSVMPIPVTQDITVQLDANGQATITPTDIDNGSSDNCSIGTLALDVTSFDCSNIGANTVTLTVTDVNGNTATSTATVTVEDNVDPTVTTQDITVELDANGQASITTADIDNGSSDACGIASSSIDITSFDCSNVGANTVTLTVTDVNGNTATNTAMVTVEDNIAPTAQARNITVQLDADGFANILPEDIDNGSSDNCGVQNIAIDQSDFDCADLGENTITLTVTDVNGNNSTATATVTVEDNIAPTLVCMPYEWDFDANGMLELEPEDLIESVSDNCSYTATISQSIFDDRHIGDNPVLVTITDDNGNSTSCETIVRVTFDCLVINSIITPNGDSKNDTWEIGCLNSLNNEVAIYNRFGQLVYQATNYTGGWDGRNTNGNELPQAAYYYVIKATIGGQQQIFKGNITILKK